MIFLWQKKDIFLLNHSVCVFFAYIYSSSIFNVDCLVTFRTKCTKFRTKCTKTQIIILIYDRWKSQSEIRSFLASSQNAISKIMRWRTTLFAERFSERIR